MKKIYLVIIGILYCAGFMAQNYILDTSFNHTGQVVTPKRISASFGFDLLYQPDGKIVVAGDMHIPDPVLTVTSFLSYRFDAFGKPDVSYGDTGKALLKFYPNSQDRIQASVIQPDSKIIMAGVANNNFALVRYHPNGTPDSTFGVNGRVETDAGSLEDEILDIKLLANGSILVAGKSYRNDYDFALARYKNDGQLDTTFGTGGIVVSDLYNLSFDMCFSCVVLPGGKIITAGYRWDNATGYDFAVVRYNADGSIDNSFGANGLVTVDFGSIYDYGYNVHVKANGNLTITGCTALGDNFYKFAAAELLPGGSLNPAFGNAGRIVATSNQRNSFFNKSVLLTNNDILLCGISYDLNGGPTHAVLMRLKANGQFDYNLNAAGFVTLGAPAYVSHFNDILVQPDGKIVVCGSTDLQGDMRFQVLRYKMAPQTATDLDEDQQSSFVVYPNPCNNVVHIEPASNECVITLLNMLGETILTAINVQNIDVSDLPPGTYIIDYKTPGGAAGRKTRLLKL